MAGKATSPFLDCGLLIVTRVLFGSIRNRQSAIGWLGCREERLLVRTKNFFWSFAAAIFFMVLEERAVISQESVLIEPVGIQSQAAAVLIEPPNQTQDLPLKFYGVASWYSESDPFINLRTANGEIFDDTKLTCASWDFPFGTLLEVTHLDSGRKVICRVNDRGPSKRLHRLIDLTLGTFRQIADPRQGLVAVSLQPLRNFKSR